MKVVEKTKAKESLGDYAGQVAKEPVVVTKNGKPMAALVSLENADMETVTLSTNPKFLALIERSRSRLLREGGRTVDEMRRRLEESA